MKEIKSYYSLYSIKSEIALDKNIGELKLAHPAGNYCAYLSGAPADNQFGNIVCRIVFEASNLTQAAILTKEYITQFLHYMMLATNLSMKLGHHHFILDWTPGKHLREAYLFGPQLIDEPAPILTSGLITSVQILLDAESSPVVKRALRWFASGIKSRIPDDQFQYFWFVVEMIAEANKTSEKITDKCQQCKGDLSCKSCGAASVHKPFAKQAIEKLLKDIGLTATSISELLSVRNKLFHGATKEEVELEIIKSDKQFTFARAVDKIAEAAWCAIFRSFIHKDENANLQLKLLKASTYINWKVSAKAHIEIGIGGDPNDPHFSNVVMPHIGWSKNSKNIG